MNQVKLNNDNYAHILITSRIQGTKPFSQHLFPNDQDDVFNISLSIYPIHKLSSFASWKLMIQRLKLDESEILQLTKETNEEKEQEKEEERKSGNNKLKEIMISAKL